MKKPQCAKCGQVFWAEPKQVDERLIGCGEWIQSNCRKCPGEWAIVEPAARRLGPATKRMGRPRAIRRIRRKAATPPGREKPAFTPARIRSPRRRLGLSQMELAVLIGVNRATANMWERGKTKPKEDKMERLAGLAGMEK